jgi:hypothetical protein
VARSQLSAHPAASGAKLTLIVVLSVVSLYAAAHSARADAAPARRCADLRGRRLATDHGVKLVERGGARRASVYACTLPNGRVRLAGVAFDETIQSGYSINVVALAGTWIAMSFRNVVDFHGGEEIDKVCDARSGRTYRYFEAGIPEGPGFEEAPDTSGAVERVRLNRFGQLALALVREGTTEVRGFEPDGARRLLDSARLAQLSPNSLTLQGHTVSWVDAGAARSATL